MAKIKLFDNSADGIKGTRKHKYNPSERYKDIIENTNKRIEDYHHELDLVYMRASAE